MKWFALILTLTIAFGFISCSEDSPDPVGPTIDRPTQLSATAVSDSEIGLTWDNRSDGVSSVVQRAAGENGSWETIANPGLNVEHYNDTGLDEGSLYRYQVMSKSEGMQSSPSTATEAVTLPTGPANLEVTTVNGNTISLIWEDISSTEDAYELYRSVGVNSNYVRLETLSSDAVEFEDVDLEDNTTYYYKLKAELNGEYSTWSNEVSTATFAGPTDMEAHTISNSEILVSWHDNSLTEDGFHLQRSPGNSGNWSLISTVEPGNVNYTDSNLSEGAPYDYRIRAFTGFGESSWSNTGSAQTLPTMPSVPTIENDPDADLQVNLFWDDNSEAETGYEIERRLGERGAFDLIAELDANSTIYTDTDVLTATTYYYQIRAITAESASEWTDLISITTRSLMPSAPSNLSGDSPHPSKVELSWTDNSVTEDGFVIERSLFENAGWMPSDSVEVGETSYEDIGLTETTTYHYRIYAYNGYGDSDVSNVLTITTGSPPPNSPTGLNAHQESPFLIVIDWNRIDEEADGLVMERSFEADAGWERIATIADPEVVRYIDRTVDQMTTYYYRAYTYNVNGNSFYSATVSETTPQAPPTSPLELTATAPNYFTVILNWVDGSEDELGFNLERYDPEDRQWEPLTQTATDVLSYMDNTVVQASFYQYRVNAYNAGGESYPWVETEVETPDGPPGAPSELLAEAVDYGIIRVTWGAGGSYNEDGFILERKGPDDMDFQAIVQVDHQIYGYDDENLPSESYFTYRVKAFNVTGSSEFSDTSGAETLSLVLLDDGFEEYNADAAPNGDWFIQEDGAATVMVTNTEAHSGDKSLHLADPDSSSLAWAWVTHDVISDAGYFSIWLKLNPSGELLLCGTNNATSFNWQLNFEYTDSSEYRTLVARDAGALTDTEFEWPIDQWLHVEVEFDFSDGLYDVHIDNELIVEGFGMQPTIVSASRVYMLSSTWTPGPGIDNFGGVEDTWADDVYMEIILPENRSATPPPETSLDVDRIDSINLENNFIR